MKKLVFVLLGCAIVFGGIFGFLAYKSKMAAEYMANMPIPAIPVTATKATQQNWPRTVPAIGVMEALHGVDVSTEVAGTVQTIVFESGTRVAKGDLLVQLDAEVEQAELRSVQAQLDLAQNDVRRARALAPNKTISISALDKAESDAKVAAAAVGRLTAVIAKKTIVAPFDGVLGIRRINLGQYLDPGTPIVNLQDLSAMLVNFGVSQKALSDIHVGQPIRMATDSYPGRIFDGKVTTIAPLIDDRTGMVAVQGRFENADGALRPGMYARLDVVLPEMQQTTIVPQPAISYSLYGNTVYVIKRSKNENGEETSTVERAMVETGTRRGNWVIITKGISPGDEIVTSGQLKLTNGAHVTVTATEVLTPPQTLPLE